MELLIRRVQEQDAAAILELLNPIIQAEIYTVMDEQFTVEDQTDFIRSFPEHGVYHIALAAEHQKVLGIQDVMPISSSKTFKHVGEISTFVALTSHNQGIGQHLSQATFKTARALGYLKLRATVRADNLQALAFYQSQGFEQIGTARQHVFLNGRYIDEILFEKFLD